jgi:hypothetical protein
MMRSHCSLLLRYTKPIVLLEEILMKADQALSIGNQEVVNHHPYDKMSGLPKKTRDD